MKGLQSQLRTMEGSFNTSFGRIEGMARNFGKGILQGLIAGVSVGALTNFTNEILNLADSLQNLSDQTGLSVELLSGLKSPLEDAGSSMDAFAKGVFNLQKNLGNVDDDSDKVAQSIKRLGLNLNDLRNSTPDEFIRKVTDALAKIENPVERNTVLFNLLGKSAKELGPAFQQLVGRFEELKSKGMTAADVKLLDDVGDALTRLKNQALLLGAEGVAGLLRFFGVFDQRGKLVDSLIKIEDEISRIDNMLQKRQGLRDKGLGFLTATDDKEQLERRRQLLEQQKQINQQLNNLNKPTGNIAPFKGISDSAKKAKNDVDNFLDGLEKQLAGIEAKKIELKFGDQAGLSAQLDAQFERFKDNLRDKQLPVPKGLEEFFKNLKDRILAANDELRRMQFELGRLDELGKAFSQDSAEFLNVDQDTAKANERRDELKKQLDELRQSLQIAAIDTSTPEGKEKQRIASITVEFVKTAKQIEELGRATGASQEQIAEDVALAWKKSLNEIGEVADETSEFMRRAMERGFDAVSDAIKDLINGEIKSFQDLGKRLNQVFTSILADQATLELKKLFLGEDFGKKGGQVGGIFKDIKDLLTGTSQRQSGNEQSSAVQAFADAANEGVGEATKMGERALQAQVATADTLIRSLSAQAQSALTTTADAIGQGFDSFLKMAIEAIQAAMAAAAASSNSGGGMPGMDMMGGGGGGGGFMDMFGGMFGGGGGSEAGGSAFTNAWASAANEGVGSAASTGASSAASSSWLDGLMSLFSFAHTGGEIRHGGAGLSKRRVELVRMHSGGEVPAMLQVGEFVVSKPAASMIGTKNLEAMNTTGRMPQDGGGNKYEFHFHDVKDADSFRRSRPQLLSDLTRAVAKGQKHL